jgi:sodium-dependent dicarboxylate transporter 2/3/5
MAEAKKPWTPVRIALVALPILFFIALELKWFGPPAPAHRGLALLVIMAVWWVTETFPLHWTSLLPLVFIALFPALLDAKTKVPLSVVDNVTAVGWAYINPFIMIFMGGMLIGVAMEEHNLHRRIALSIMKAIGSSPRRILLGFCVSTAFLSMWISNTATAVMMVPIGLAVISQLEMREGRKLPLLGQSIMLSIAYAANIGGIGTLIGTPPNMQLRQSVEQTYGQSIDFLRFMTVGTPVVLLLLPVMYGLLVWIMRKEEVATVSSDVLDQELAKLGRMSKAEKAVLGVFVFTSAMWILNEPLSGVVERSFAKGSFLASIKGGKLDAFFALLAPVMLLSVRVLSTKGLRRMPWDVLILLGGSYAMGEVVKGSGLADEMSTLALGAKDLHPLLLMMVVTSVTVLLTAFSANAASAQLMFVMITGTLDPTKTTPKTTVPLMYGSAISSSCDFMLPCGTPPNAIVFGTRYVSIRAMAGTGFALDLLSVILVALWIWGAARHWIT